MKDYKRIELLRYLTTPQLADNILNEFNISKLSFEKLIASVEDIERDLIKTNRLGRVFLTRKLDWLSNNEIKSLLEHYALSDYQIEILDEIPSTNSYVIDKIDSYTSKSVVTTEFQSCGRARANKRWMSRLAKDITLSCVYWFDLDFKLELLPLITAVAVNRLLKDFQIRSKIKWPNDILLENGEKICGILVDSGVKSNKRFAIVGIGLDNIADNKRDALLVELIRNLDNVISEYQVLGFNLLKQEWLDNCIHYQKEVKIIKAGTIIDTGVNIGISANGALLVHSNNGETVEYNSAAISLRSEYF